MVSLRGKVVFFTVMAALWAACLPAARAQSLYIATINTTGLSGTSGLLAFDFLDGEGVLLNNSVLISAFATDGVLAGGGNTNSVGASGNLPGNLSLTDAEFSNETLRGITFGNALSFSLTLTENFAGGSPDQFSFFLLNASGTGSLVSTSDPIGTNALFTLDITGQLGGELSVFPSQTPNVSYNVQPQQTDIPEPGTAALLASGLMPLLRIGLRRRRGRSMPAFGRGNGAPSAA